MGNSASTHKERTENHIDFGSTRPFGTYTGPQDWNHEVVSRLIKERKLAPFYWPLEDYDDEMTDEQIMAARKVPPTEASPTSDAASDILSVTLSRSSVSTRQSERLRPQTMKIPEAQLYRGAIECPICFLYYPPNINRTRCCDHYICTECFVQIKRADPTPQHLVSEPAACPYCVQDNFGVIYAAPAWRAGIGSEGYPSPDLYKVSSSGSIAPPPPMAKQRRQSLSHTAPGVVTIDQIRPDWEAKLAAVHAAVARRANRRIIMRQVGDRLIPVGITSGRVQINTDGMGDTGPIVETDDSSTRGSRRRRHELSQLLGGMGMAGQDLEELMVMEAMRLSLLEHEQALRRQQEEEARQQRANGGEGSSTGGTNTDPAAPPMPSSAPVSGSRTPIAIPARVDLSGDAAISSSAPTHVHRLSGASILTGTPPRTNGSPLRPSGDSATGGPAISPTASMPSPLRSSRPSSLVDSTNGNPTHQAAALAATTFLNPTTVDEGAGSSSIPPRNPTSIASASVPISTEPAAPAPVININQALAGSSTRTPISRTQTMGTEMSEDGETEYVPLASPDTEDNAYLLDERLDEAMQENIELPQRSATATSGDSLPP
ncbi:hypothetical protein DACRYDRAFT_113764 [Dacryopinax primogenitus]|uniref:RING-type domain-containing protein n=1 Tax=Dacryopinax primogenitus (strain DJM 731) TaxID=1858805 RepID=M5GA77_DACPD|nr:uncharacterized protein DACRYDRAFT_113764 [Dacryopinax primogenitus]EJU05709.1 hypothetical protein DACRYDRAFT_113764 [Dacryopinax primogenitus]